MSEHFDLMCKCGERSRSGINHGEDAIRRAVQESYRVWKLLGTCWDLHTLEGHNGVSPYFTTFIVNHFEHGGFWIVSEYWSATIPERDEKYPREWVEPVCPASEPLALVAARRTLANAKEARDRLEESIRELTKLVQDD